MTMNQVALDFRPPEHSQDFERLTVRLCSLLWQRDAELLGRSGQAQHGVDVVGFDLRRGNHTRIGVQCKKRSDRSADGSIRPGGLITIQEFISELTKTESLQPKLDEFVLATTASRDAPLQSEIAALNITRRAAGLSGVSIWFWEWFQEQLNLQVEVMYEFYKGVAKAGNAYDPDKHIAALVRNAFDRPLMKTPFELESAIVAVDAGVSVLQRLLKTGQLMDASGRLVASSLPTRMTQSDDDRRLFQDLANRLDNFRLYFADLRRTEVIRDAGSMIEIRDWDARDQLNLQRAEMLRIVNKIRQEAHARSS